MASATLTSKGQITIPANVRHDLKIERKAALEDCKQTMTFDSGAAKHAGMTLIR